jgi:hypothetical protein
MGGRLMTDPTPTRPPGALLGRSVLGVFALRDEDDGAHCIVLDSPEDGSSWITGVWRASAPDVVTDTTEHASAFKAIIAFETRRLAEQQAHPHPTA